MIDDPSPQRDQILQYSDSVIKGFQSQLEEYSYIEDYYPHCYAKRH